MNLSTKLRRQGIEINPGGKNYINSQRRRYINVKTSPDILANGSCPAYTKKHTRSRIKEYCL